MANNQKYGKWESFSYNRREYNFNGRVNVKLVRNGETIAVVKTKNHRQEPKDFANEVEILASMEHPNIVTVLEHDLQAETPYMIMDFIEGGTIDHAELESWTYEERFICFQQVCQAVAYVHDRGYIKSDVFNGNVFLKEDKTPVIGDFEYSKPIENTDHIAGEMTSLAQLFWKMMYGKKFTTNMMEEKRLNEKIESLTSELEELKQEKAQLLS